MRINSGSAFWSRGHLRVDMLRLLYQILCKYLHITVDVPPCITVIEFGYMNTLRHLIWPLSAIFDSLASHGTTHEGPFMVNIPCKKFLHGRLRSIQVISIWIFCPSLLKVLFMGSKCSFRGFDLQNVGSIVQTANRHIVARNDAFCAHVGPDRTRRVAAFPIGENLSNLWFPVPPADVAGEPH